MASDFPTIGRYRIVREIARGGMGVVYEAEDPELKRRVAIKTLRDEDGGDGEDVARLRREATIAAQLRHPNIVGIYEVGTTESSTNRPVHFIAMDFVEGRTYADVLTDSTVSRADRIRMLEEVARAVAFAHEKGVIHRDLKPANILVDTQGRVILTDFGLARADTIRTKLTQSNTIMGTPRYMAPEQVEGRTADIGPRTDVYALGVILYETLTGRAPFDSDVPVKLFHLILNVEPDPPSRAAPWIERDLDGLCLKAMDKNRDRRYASALEFAEDLARFRRGEPVLAKAPSLAYRISKRLAKTKALVFTLAGAAAVILVLTAFFTVGMGQARASAIDELRTRTRSSMEAALLLRRAGSTEGFERFAKETNDACTKATSAYPELAEPHYLLGRVLRALMRDDDALRSQDEALKRDAAFGPALYERIVLTSRRYQRRIDDLAQQKWGEEGLAIVRSRKKWLSRSELAAQDAAAREFRAALERDYGALKPASIRAAEAACARGLVAWSAGNVSEALVFFDSAIGLDAGLEEAYEGIAGVELERNAYESAVAWCTKAVDKDKGYLPHVDARIFARVVWGYDLLRRSQNPTAVLEEAIRDATALLDRSPGRTDALRYRGLCRLALATWISSNGGTDRSSYHAAKADFDELRKLRKDDANVLVWRAASCMGDALIAFQKGESAEAAANEALGNLDQAITMGASGDTAWFYRGIVRGVIAYDLALRKKDADAACRDAIDELTRALERNPDRPDSWMWRGVVHAALAYGIAIRGGNPVDEYNLAMDDLDKAVDLDQQRADVRVWRGQAHLAWGGYLVLKLTDPLASYQKAAEDFGVAVELSPANAWHRRLRGNAHEARGTWLELTRKDATEPYTLALADYTEAIKLDAAYEAPLKQPLEKVQRYLKKR